MSVFRTNSIPQSDNDKSFFMMIAKVAQLFTTYRNNIQFPILYDK